MLRKLAIRDALIVAVAAAGWMGLLPLSEGRPLLSDALALLLGLGVTVSAYLLHEWGHALAGLMAGSRIHAPASLGSISLFSFDVEANSKGQFAAMSIGGFIVTAAAMGFAYLVLPDGYMASRVARGGVTVLAAITVFVEVPLLVYGLLARRLPGVVAVFRPQS
jgi:hypothetical protein